MPSSGEMIDVEKRINASQIDSTIFAGGSDELAAERPTTAQDATPHIDGTESSSKYLEWAYRIENVLGFEARGIRQVKKIEQSKKTTLGFLKIVMMWLSINTAAQNITLGSIGQSAFGLGFLDATLCSVFGGIVGSIPVAYTAGWGPWSGNRTMVREILFYTSSFTPSLEYLRIPDKFCCD